MAYEDGQARVGRWRWVCGGLALLVLASVAVALGSDGRSMQAPAAVPQPQRGPAAGAVRFVKQAHSDFDRFTRNARFGHWMRRHLWRMTTYAPYFDSRLRWYRDAWVYRDLYAIYRGSSLAQRHPDWILEDQQGNPLYIPFGCGGGTCPQYAGDVGNPSFRSDWIRRARSALRRGYRGIFIDDVNMLLRVADGAGHEVAPVDPRTGSPMTLAAWRNYVARFTAQIRRAFPRAELVHNLLWFAGDTDPAVRRELDAADLVYIEHGADDAGLQGGSGRFGFETLLAFIDRRHRAGQGVVLGHAKGDYALATYMLINSGRDAISSDLRSTPGDWWHGWSIKLGAPRAERRDWHGLLRRDFRRGLVLVNPPGSPQRTVELGRTYTDVAGGRRSSVVLPPKSGVVLRGPGSAR